MQDFLNFNQKNGITAPAESPLAVWAVETHQAPIKVKAVNNILWWVIIWVVSDIILVIIIFPIAWFIFWESVVYRALIYVIFGKDPLKSP